MARIGLVRYEDDPHRRYFRKVTLHDHEPESELDNPSHVTDGVDPARKAVIDKVDAAEAGRLLTGEGLAGLSGTPTTPAHERPRKAKPPRDDNTPLNVVRRLLKQAKVCHKDVLVDLGSGDGCFLVEAAKLGAVAIGYETDPRRNVQAKKRARDAKVTVFLIEKSFWEADLSPATVIVDTTANPAVRSMYPEGCRVITWPSSSPT